jgi:hypothetical protein
MSCRLRDVEVSMIGLSLSFCIKDIIEGRVDLDKVEKISTATFYTDRDMFHTGLKVGYCRTYWRHDPERAHKIAMDLWDAGKIDQPRTRGEKPASIHDGHWR